MKSKLVGYGAWLSSVAALVIAFGASASAFWAPPTPPTPKRTSAASIFQAGPNLLGQDPNRVANNLSLQAILGSPGVDLYNTLSFPSLNFAVGPVASLDNPGFSDAGMPGGSVPNAVTQADYDSWYQWSDLTTNWTAGVSDNWVKYNAALDIGLNKPMNLPTINFSRESEFAPPPTSFELLHSASASFGA